jgi:hypothetical protein
MDQEVTCGPLDLSFFRDTMEGKMNWKGVSEEAHPHR